MTTYRHNQYRYYFDTHIRMWTVVVLDSENNQIGHAEYFGNRKQLLTNYPEFKFIKE
jgi:hypothetical protein